MAFEQSHFNNYAKIDYNHNGGIIIIRCGYGGNNNDDNAKDDMEDVNC